MKGFLVGAAMSAITAGESYTARGEEVSGLKNSDENIIEGWYTITSKDILARQGPAATVQILNNLDHETSEQQPLPEHAL